MLIKYSVLVTYLMLPLAVRQLREMVIQHSASEAILAENTQTVSECLTQPFSDNILPPQNSGESEADRPEIEPVHAATALQEMISRKRIVKWWMIQCQKAFRDTLKKFLMKPGFTD
jgi:hypothetical protein